jgi:hypothetical protein
MTNLAKGVVCGKATRGVRLWCVGVDMQQLYRMRVNGDIPSEASSKKKNIILNRERACSWNPNTATTALQYGASQSHSARFTKRHGQRDFEEVE